MLVCSDALVQHYKPRVWSPPNGTEDEWGVFLYKFGLLAVGKAVFFEVVNVKTMIVISTKASKVSIMPWSSI